MAILETREVVLLEDQLNELLNWDTSDMDYNNKFYDVSVGKSLIGFHICAALDQNFANEIAGYLTNRHVELEFYLSFNFDWVNTQSQKFFKEYQKEDKGQKIN